MPATSASAPMMIAVQMMVMIQYMGRMLRATVKEG